MPLPRLLSPPIQLLPEELLVPTVCTPPDRAAWDERRHTRTETPIESNYSLSPADQGLGHNDDDNGGPHP